MGGVHADEGLHQAELPTEEGPAQVEGVPFDPRLDCACPVARLHVQRLHDALCRSLQALEVQGHLLLGLGALRRKLLPDRLELPSLQSLGEHVVPGGNDHVLDRIVVLEAKIVAFFLHQEVQGGGQVRSHGARATRSLGAAGLPQDHMSRSLLVVLQPRDGRGTDLDPLGIQARESHLDALEGDTLNSVRHVHLQHAVLFEHVLDDLHRVLRLVLGEGLRAAAVLQRSQFPILADLTQYTGELCGGSTTLFRLLLGHSSWRGRRSPWLLALGGLLQRRLCPRGRLVRVFAGQSGEIEGGPLVLGVDML
mmetsp:Transcript_68621/g.146919  ORF Transcript_68621/g.146919 Transcript_68621/m.146919 type:complete len:308 (+) Transcript_68621:139-1062(+)